MADLKDLLDYANTGGLRLRAIAVLDWRDGPIEGIAETGGEYWYFRLLAERVMATSLDERFYTFAPLSDRGAQLIESALAAASSETVVWPYGDGAEDREIQRNVDAVIATAGTWLLLVRSDDFTNVRGMWLLTPAAAEPPAQGGPNAAR